MTLHIPMIAGMEWVMIPLAILAVAMVLKWLWSWITG